MKLFDALLGRTELKKPKIEALFALSTAYLSMEAFGFKPSGVTPSVSTPETENFSRALSGICFKPIRSSRFSRLEIHLRDLLRLSTSETGAACQFQTDEYNHNWVILRDEDFEDLVTTTHLISETIIEHNFEERLLCSVFAFGDVYLIYNYKEGTFYPFAPLADRNRDNNLEFRLRSAMEGELPIEKEMEKWHPLWGIPF